MKPYILLLIIMMCWGCYESTPQQIATDILDGWQCVRMDECEEYYEECIVIRGVDDTIPSAIDVTPRFAHKLVLLKSEVK